MIARIRILETDYAVRVKYSGLRHFATRRNWQVRTQRRRIYGDAQSLEPVDEMTAVSEVWLHGEVVENEADGGPRIVVEVQPLDAKGHAIEFNLVLCR